MHGYFNLDEVVSFYSGFCGVWPDKKRIEYLLKTLGLWEHRKKKVRALSGGMKRRMLMVKALVHSPKLILLDEPTAGVDPDFRAAIWDFITELKKEGSSILFTTHYLEEAENLCDRVAFIHEGKIREMGSYKETHFPINNPTDSYQIKGRFGFGVVRSITRAIRGLKDGLPYIYAALFLQFGRIDASDFH